MTQATLPARPNLDFLKKLAKRRLRSMRASPASAKAKLADAQLAVARDHGFASWRKLRAHVIAATAAVKDEAFDPQLAAQAAVREMERAWAESFAVAESLALIETYADPKKLANEATKNLAVMLHWGHTRGARWLLEHGADPNRIVPQYGNSALHEAVLRRVSDPTLKLLLRHGGDPTIRNKQGFTALQLARMSDQRGPNRPCPTGRDGAPGSPEKVKAAARILAILQSKPSGKSKKGGRR